MVQASSCFEVAVQDAPRPGLEGPRSGGCSSHPSGVTSFSRVAASNQSLLSRNTDFRFRRTVAGGDCGWTSAPGRPSAMEVAMLEIIGSFGAAVMASELSASELLIALLVATGFVATGLGHRRV
jgi:hypothetical protein